MLSTGGSFAGLAIPATSTIARGQSTSSAVAGNLRDRCRGLLLGGLIGDALGGPFEFSQSPERTRWLCSARSWPKERQLDAPLLAELADSCPLQDYRVLRPEAASYGPWQEGAAAGTLTDDSRHKIVLVRAIGSAGGARNVAAADIARAFIAFTARPTAGDDDRIAALNEEGFREYRYAARWLLGSRDLQQARPLARLWAGVNNCSGQMLLPPLAVAYAGDPTGAYRAAYELDFIDTPMARDMAAGLVAGLAAALAPELNEAPATDRWQALLAAMRETDPFGYADVPYAGRQLIKWIDKSEELAHRAAGSPRELYRLLEDEGKPVYWWDAHFTLLVPLSILQLSSFNPLAAMHLALDFGHDTDSYAQVLGCLVGAVHGADVFPAQMQQAVEKQLRADYEENIEDWLNLLAPSH